MKWLQELRGSMSILPYIPAIFAAVTDVGTAAFVNAQQPYYPFRFLFFQLAMFGLAFLMAAPPEYRVVRISAFLLLIFGVLVAGFSSWIRSISQLLQRRDG